ATMITLIVLNGVVPFLVAAASPRSSLALLGVMPYVEALALVNGLDTNWLLDFPAPDDHMRQTAEACALSVALYAVGTIVLACWTLKSFDRVIDRAVSTAVATRNRPLATRKG